MGILPAEVKNAVKNAAKNTKERVRNAKERALTTVSANPHGLGKRIKGMFSNPVSHGADPWIIRHGDSYLWCYANAANTKIYINSFSDLNGPFGKAHLVFRAPSEGPCSSEVWAPELHFLDGRFYIYFAASDGNNANHLSFVLQSDGADPLGPYSLHGPLATGDGHGPLEFVWAIDMTILNHGGRRYAVWSGWDAPGSDRQFIYIAPMLDPLTLAGRRVCLCSNCSYPWELTEDGAGSRGLNEGPQVLQHGGRTFIVYSCGASWLSTYKLGMLELLGANPLDPRCWRKHPSPVFASAGGTIGVGHSCFVASPDLRELWHVYHAKTTQVPGWDDRKIFMQPLGFAQDGFPLFGSPIQRGELQAAPSGSGR
mmetsp:Transcript_45818/g.106460  ORF Transcript_45818/g.106460 Transcript_45818/m.106460 type:complete len:369 (-) Transcript_45818:19-1125(-)